MDIAVVRRGQPQVMLQRFVRPLSRPSAPVRCQPIEERDQLIEALCIVPGAEQT